MARPPLEVADIFRDQGPAWRFRHAGHVTLSQLKVMSAIEHCRRAELGGHALRCNDCDTVQIAYNSCRNRHCTKCQSLTAKHWLAARQAELLPVEYYHLVFTLPAPIAEIAYQNKAQVYDLLVHATSETLRTLAADPKHLGARIGVTAVLHTWGSAMTHHPALHHPGRWPFSRWHTMDPVPTGLLFACAGTLTFVPPAVPRTFGSGVSGGASRLLWAPPTPQRSQRLGDVSQTIASSRMGGIRKTTLRRPRGSPRLPLTVYPPGCDLQSSPDCL